MSNLVVGKSKLKNETGDGSDYRKRSHMVTNTKLTVQDILEQENVKKRMFNDEDSTMFVPEYRLRERKTRRPHREVVISGVDSDNSSEASLGKSSSVHFAEGKSIMSSIESSFASLSTTDIIGSVSDTLVAPRTPSKMSRNNSVLGRRRMSSIFFAPTLEPTQRSRLSGIVDTSTRRGSSFAATHNSIYRIGEIVHHDGTVIPQERTVRELVADLEMRIQNNLPLPAYHPQQPQLLSPISESKRSQVMKSVVPSIEDILLKADKRIRQRMRKNEKKDQGDAHKLAQAKERLRKKEEKMRKHLEKIKRRKRQWQWLRIVQLSNYIVSLRPLISLIMRHREKRNMTIREAYKIITSFVKTRVRRMLFGKFLQRIKDTFCKCSFPMALMIRAWRKRRAVKLLMKVLTGPKVTMSFQTIVQNFLVKVNFVENTIWHFLNCKRERIKAMAKVWDKIELTYIKKRLRSEAEKNKGPLVIKTKQSLNVEIEEIMSKAGVLDHDARWADIDSRMEGAMEKLKAKGEEYVFDTLSALRAPIEKRDEFLIAYLESRRREYVLSQQKFTRSTQVKSSEFSPEDAVTFLKGPTMNVVKLLIHQKNSYSTKAQKAVEAFSRKPFMLYTKEFRKECKKRVTALHREMLMRRMEEKREDSTSFESKFMALKAKRLADEKAAVALKAGLASPTAKDKVLAPLTAQAERLYRRMANGKGAGASSDHQRASRTSVASGATGSRDGVVGRQHQGR